MHSIYVHSKKLKQKKWYFIKPPIKIIFFSLPITDPLCFLSSWFSLPPSLLPSSDHLSSSTRRRLKPQAQSPKPPSLTHFRRLCFCFGIYVCVSEWISGCVCVWYGSRCLCLCFGMDFGLCLRFGLGFRAWVSASAFRAGFRAWVFPGCSRSGLLIFLLFFFFPSFSNLDFAHISARFFFCFFFSSLVLDEFWPQWWRCNCPMVFVALTAVVVVFYIILLCC